ncbi:MAG: UvrD-helicase domain-containing protein [Verrucomicrobiales bacterium]|nr:UvrD-helicase domain-containing protein [Verrucomicrobiales bacterium]
MARSYTLDRPSRGEGETDFRAELNDQQYAAVTSPPGQQLVIAGAGSGKTRTLTYRVAYLLENGISAENILLLTFTNKASREMLDRVVDLVTADASRLWGGTFHSTGNRILRENAHLMGFTKSFSIMDREDQKDLMASAIVEAGVDTKSTRFPKPDVLGDMFSLAVNMEVEVAEIVDSRYEYFMHLLEPIEKVQKRYVAKKKESNSMDFDDLLVLTVELLKEEPEVLERYQYQFQFILVDEYQDTNSLQSELIDMLAGKHGNIMVVGDDAQSIYSWRGANFENILKFTKRYPEAVVFKIEQNYRSVPEVLDLANAAIAVNKRQFKKELAASREMRDQLPGLVKLNDPADQASFVAQRILELRDEGIELEEMAVLYRAHYQAMEVQLELTNRGIPFVITSGLRFFEQAHIKDVAAFMKVAVNRQDEVAFKRMVKLLAGVGNVSADKMWAAWCACDGSKGDLPKTFSEHFLKFKVPAKAKANWEQLAYTMDELVEDGKLVRPSDMMVSITEGVYDEYMREAFKNYDNRKQDLEQLMAYGEQFDDVLEFLGQLALLSGVDGEPNEKAKQEEDKESVTLSSVHQAKGLEWKVVFILWMTDGMFPGRRVIESDDEESMEEERRLFYVAVTRAKDELYLCQPMFWPTSYTGEIVQRPSRFLEDFPADFVEEWNVGGGGF